MSSQASLALNSMPHQEAQIFMKKYETTMDSKIPIKEKNPIVCLDSISESEVEPGDSESDPFINLNTRLTDSDGDYKIYHYIVCDDKSENVIKNSRGIIRSKDEIVCKTFNFTPEFIGINEPNIEAVDSILSVAKNFSVYMAEEGTLIRLWFHNNSWHISTHKKLDANRSRWGSKESHGDMFIKSLLWYIKNNLQDKIKLEDESHVLDVYLSTLKQDRVYTFIVRTTIQNRIVCTRNFDPMIYFAGEFGLVGEDKFVLLNDNTSNIERPVKLTFENCTALFHIADNISPKRAQGVMIYYDEGLPSFGTIKLTSSAYQSLSDIRGNFPSVKFRYLQLRNDPESVQKLYKLYPEYYNSFNEYETIIHGICDKIYEGYKSRYINHEFTVLPQELWYVTKDIHDDYIKDSIKNRISISLVHQHVNALSAVRLNYIIRCHYERQNNKNDNL